MVTASGMPIRFPQARITLPVQYFGSVDYYARMAACGRVVVDDTLRYDKRFKSAHRCLIADTRGKLRITVPVRKPDHRGEGKLGWADIAISDHGQWWQDADVSLASAYGRTPFYEFYIDRLRRFFSRTTPDEFDSVAALDRAVDRSVRAILGLSTEVIYASELKDVQPEISATPIPDPEAVEYYQVRKAKLGFIPELSILDLIFNMGPEAAVVLHSMIRPSSDK